MISRCSEARDRTSNRNEWSSETTTDLMPAGYRRMLATSIDAIRSKFSVATGIYDEHLQITSRIITASEIIKGSGMS